MHGQAENPLHGSVLFGESKDHIFNRILPTLSWKWQAHFGFAFKQWLSVMFARMDGAVYVGVPIGWGGSLPLGAAFLAPGCGAVAIGPPLIL